MKYICLLTLLLFIVLLLCSCSEQKQTAKKVSWLLARDKMPGECARLYPNKDSIIVRDSLHIDTLIQDGKVIYDTVKCKDTIIYRQHSCPPAQVITKNIYHDSLIIRTDMKQVEALNSVIRAKDKQVSDKDDIIIKQQKKIDQNDKWRLWFFLLLGFNILAIVFRFFVIKRPL